MQVDWNPPVHILDALSEGTHPLLELDFMLSDYEPGAFVEALLFLADRGLIELSAGDGPFTPIPEREWTQRLRDAFGSRAAEGASMTGTAIDLTDGGRHVLRLLRIGHP